MSTSVSPSGPSGRKVTDRGVVAVEFALVLPLLVILIFTAVVAGSVYLDQLQIQAASREAARAGSIDPSLACAVAAADLTGDGFNNVNCTLVRTCGIDEVSEVRLVATQTVSVPLVGDRMVTLRATSAFRCAPR